MARTKQTARRSTGALAPRRHISLGVPTGTSRPGKRIRATDRDLEVPVQRASLRLTNISGSGSHNNVIFLLSNSSYIFNLVDI